MYVRLVDGTLTEFNEGSSPERVMMNFNSFDELKDMIDQFASGNCSTLVFYDPTLPESDNLLNTFTDFVYDDVNMSMNSDGTITGIFKQHQKTNFDIYKEKAEQYDANADYIEAAKIMLGEV